MKYASSFRGLALCAALFIAAPWLAAVETVPAPDSGGTERVRLQAGDVAPDFTVIGPGGETMKLSDFRGKMVLLDIWATWCGPCIASMPHQSGLAEKFAKDGLVVLAVCASDTRANYDGWVSRNRDKYKFLTAHDPAGRDWKSSVFNTHYGVGGFPSLFLIDRDGKLVGQTAGGGPNENPHLTRLLAKGGLPIDTSHLPPERTDAPKSIPAVKKTMARPAGSAPLMGGGMAPANSLRIPTAQLGSVKFGDEVADFVAVGVDGREIKLSGFKGKPVLITFWTGARAPADDVAALHAAYKDQGLAVWAINVATEQADFDTWAKASAAALGYTVSWDSAGKAFMESSAHMNFGVGMFPAYVVVGADGRFRGGIIGMGPKVGTWVRQSLDRAGVKLTAADQAAVLETLKELAAARPAQDSRSAPAAPPADRPRTLAAGDVAPDFVMHDVDGNEVRLADFKDKIVILDFWAVWCGPCIASFPHTQALAAKYKDQGVVVLASGTSDTIARFKEWIPRNQPKYPDMVWTFDPNERGSATFEERASSKLYGVTGIPTQFVIGRDGKIAAVIIGNGGKEDARTEAALAGLGVKVDEAAVAKGREQLAKAAEAAKARAAAAEEEKINPKPRFTVNYGKLKAGEAVPDLTLTDATGTAVSLGELTRGKTTVLSVWSGTPGADVLNFQESWSRNYAGQNVQFIAMAAYASAEQVAEMRAALAGKISFPLLADPAGAPPRPDKPMDEMSNEEVAAFRQASSAHFGKAAPILFTGGAMAPLPHNYVMDAQGRFVGFFVGAGPGTAESLGNLLLRAGVKLSSEDTPARVFTVEETKPPEPEARREMIKIGAMAPDFTTQDLAGKDVKLSDYRGKVVILDFWATWCGPCIAAFPHTQEVAAQYKDQDVVVLGSATSDARAAFERWVKANQEKYPDIHFSHDAAERKPERASLALYGVSGIPTQFVIDREGRIADIVIGYMKGEVILDAALAKAGIKVDPAIVEKAAADLARRKALSGEAPAPSLRLAAPKS
ncbi:MAG TPA: redoxin domain-containing protein [Opitutaceae bacterium]|nr:redoxin domain-containing protein [Opitutaceae bacterium]